MAFCAQPVGGDVFVEADRYGLADTHYFTVVGQDVGHCQVFRRCRLECHAVAGDAAESTRLGVEGVLLVVTERLGRRPGQSVGGAELSVDRIARFVDHGDGAQDAVAGGDCDRGGVHRYADGLVGDRRLQPGHQQVAIWIALFCDHLRCWRSRLAGAAGEHHRHRR